MLSMDTRNTKAEAGMNCPECNAVIRPTIENLLLDGGINCPNCNLRLNVDPAGSGDTLDQLRSYYEARERAERLAKGDGS